MSPVRPHIVSVMTTSSHGGAEYANVDLLDALAGRGWHATLLTDMPELAAGTRVRVREIDLGPKLGRRTAARVAAGFLPWTVRLRRELAAEAALGPIDVTLLHFKKEQLMTPLLSRRIAGRVVWAEWGPLPRPMREGAGRWAYLAAAAGADHIVAVSDGTEASLVQAGVDPRKVSVLPPIVSADVHRDVAARTATRAAWGASEDTYVVGCVSRLARKKRVDVVIDAVARMPGDVMLVIAGTGDELERLEHRAAPLGDRVKFLPSVRGHVNEILSAFDVQVFAPQEEEGLPRSLMLGMLMGLPVIATAPAGAASLLGDDAIARPANDPAAVAALLEARRADPAGSLREGDALRAIAAQRFEPAHLAVEAEQILLGRVRAAAPPAPALAATPRA